MCVHAPASSTQVLAGSRPTNLGSSAPKVWAVSLLFLKLPVWPFPYLVKVPLGGSLAPVGPTRSPNVLVPALTYLPPTLLEDALFLGS